MTVKSSDNVYFVTSPDLPFFPGRGGTEAFVFSHIRELRARGIDARLVTVGLTQKDGRDLVPDIPFVDVSTPEELLGLNATLVGVCDPLALPTTKPGFIMVHVPPISSGYNITRFKKAIKTHKLIANSQFTRQQWAQVLGVHPQNIPIVYPFADTAFAATKRPKSSSGTKLLFAGRLHITKGIYLLLEALHHPKLKDYTVTITTAGKHTQDTQLIMRLLQQHPRVTLTDARTSPLAMAELMAAHDILVMPSNHFFWQEAFGMLSVEAQHAGCQVVASDTAGIPETNAGSLHLFEPGNSHALAAAIAQARQQGPVSQAARKRIAQKFTLAQSVDSLLAILNT